MAAGNIDSLNFEVILNDKKFEQSVQKDIELAKKLNTSLTEILNAKNRINTGSKTAYLDEQKLAQAAAKTAEAKAKQALAEQKVRTETEKTALAQQKVKAAIEKSAGSLTGTGSSLTRVWLRFSATVWSIISAIRLFTRTIGTAIKKISEFQQANANLATIMQVSRREIEVLTNDALMLGRTTEWTASQVTELQTALAKLGYNIPQIRNMQASVLQFATAVGANLPEAANLAGASLRMFGLHSTEMRRTLEILTASTNKTALDFEKLKVSLPYVGAIAHSIGLDIAETASLLGVLTNAGLESSRAGTGLRQVLLELSKTGGKLQTAMGGNVKTFDDLVRGLEGMRDRGLEAGEATKLVSTRASSALLILANGVDDIKRLNNEIRDSDGLLKNIQSERLNTLHGSVLLLKSAWEGLIQTFRDSAGPMKDIVDWLTKIVRATSLAASRANRVAQGTKDVIGSDTLTQQFKEQFEGIVNNLVGNGMSMEKAAKEAAKVVNEEMQKWRDSAFAANTHDDVDEKGWYKFLTHTVPIVKWATKGATRKWRAADEQVDAIDATMSAMTDFMANYSTEQGEVAANNYLEEWRLVFDTKGAQAARDAADKIIKGISDDDEMKQRLLKKKNELEGYIGNGGKEGATDRGKGESAADKARKKAIADIRANISLLEKYKAAYEKLSPVIGEDAASAWVFENMGKDVSGLDEELEKLIESLREMGEEGKEAAGGIEASLGLDAVNKVIKAKQEADKAQKALEKYQETFREWAGQDFNLGGTGFEYDIRKVFSDYNTKISGVDEKYLKAVKEAQEAHKGNADAIAAEIEKLKELADAEKDYVRAQAQESINDLAQSFLKDQYLLRGVNLDNLAGKSIGQIRRLREELIAIGEDAKRSWEGNFDYIESLLGSWGMTIGELTEDDFGMLSSMLDESTVSMIKMAQAAKQSGLTLDTLGDKIKAALDKGLKELKLSERNAIGKLAKYAASQVISLADSFRELGEATGDAGLTEAADNISTIANIAKNAAAGFAQGGWIGAVVGGLVSIAQAFVDAETKARQLEKAIQDIRIEAQRASFQDTLSNGVSGVFGEDFTARIRNAIDGLGQLAERQGELNDALVKYRKIQESNTEMWFNGQYDGPAENTAFVTGKSYIGGLHHDFKTLRELAEDFNMELTDVNGNLNPQLLQAVLDTYGELNTGSEEWLKGAIAYAEDYAAAMEQIDEATKDIFGNLASDMADQFIDNYMRMGNAVDDLSDTFANLGDSILRSFLQSYILEEILGKYQDEANEALRKYSHNEMTPEDYAAWLKGFADNVQMESERVAPAINEMIEAFKDRGLMNIDEDTGNSLGSGIKSITEDTANLLASYINAIRADVSSIRMMQERGWESINLLGSSVPTLNEHLAQIAATNFDIAQSNQSILAELQSVIGAPGTSGMVVRVESY